MYYFVDIILNCGFQKTLKIENVFIAAGHKPSLGKYEIFKKNWA